MSDEVKHYGVLGMHWGIRRALRKVPETRTAKKLGKTVVVTDFGTAGAHINERPTKAQIRRAKSPIRDEVQKWFARKQAEADRYAKIEERVLTKYDAALKEEYKRIDKMKLGKVSTFLTKLKAESANYRSSDQELAVRLAKEMERQVSANKQRKSDKAAAIRAANAKNEAAWQERMKEISSLPFKDRLAAFLKADRETSREYVNDLYAIEEKYK